MIDSDIPAVLRGFIGASVLLRESNDLLSSITLPGGRMVHVDPALVAACDLSWKRGPVDEWVEGVELVQEFSVDYRGNPHVVELSTMRGKCEAMIVTAVSVGLTTDEREAMKSLFEGWGESRYEAKEEMSRG